ncbi:MAG TPA: hypothetical protein VJ770_00655 [Stellaceae bacterium]|nr:hypothetical protein [Stellaceae bacterium]
MNRTSVPLYYYGTERARAALGRAIERVAQEAYLELGRVAGGRDIHHHQFRTHAGVRVAVASRRRRSGAVEIEIDLVTARLPARTFTAEEARPPTRVR